MEYYYSFKSYLKKLHNKKIWRVPLSTGYSCPNRIKSTGCTFCDGKSFIAEYMNYKNIEDQLKYGIDFFGKKFEVNFFYGYFQQNSSTFGKTDDLVNKYETVLSNQNILGLIISTRPDCIDKTITDKIKELKIKYDKDIWIELGLQSVYDKTLSLINRNHTYYDFKKAVKIINDVETINIGVHMIIGLPDETPQTIFNGFKILFSENKIQGLKMRILDILPDTEMESYYKKSPKHFYNFSNNEYIELICNILEIIPENTVILRTLNYNPINLINKDKKLLTKDQILDGIRKKFIKRGTKQGCYFNKDSPNCPHPALISTPKLFL
ncbi:MAG: TIGR01212 family radical SAM protein [Spirochaetes bacterium]|nr:TIGR01212 family radical SAM protein [Spirochaetota bacterium]